MTAAHRLQIVSMRLDGRSTTYIARQLGYTHQGVTNYINRLNPGRKPDPDKVRYPDMDDEMRERVINAIVIGDGDLEGTCHLANESKSTILPILDYLTVWRRKCGREDSVYPNIATWMRRHMVSVSDLAPKLGMAQGTLTTILSGHSHLRLNVAEKLKKITGLSLREIYYGHLEPVEEQIKKNKEAFAARRALEEKKKATLTLGSRPHDDGAPSIILPPAKRRGTA